MPETKAHSTHRRAETVFDQLKPSTVFGLPSTSPYIFFILNTYIHIIYIHIKITLLEKLKSETEFRDR